MDDETGFPAPSADIQTLAPNGINGSTGRSVLESVPLSEARKHALGLAADPEDLERLRNRADDARPKYSLKAGLSAQKLSEAGWGVIFHRDESDAVRNALRPLLDWRKSAEQAGAAYKEFSGQNGYFPDDDKLRFLGSHQAGLGPADPDHVPYYLLIIGGPEKIPYEFQYQLDIQYAVGRICFDDPSQYGQYARNVVTAEKEGLALPRRAVFFGTEHAGDLSTQRSARQLVTPLVESTGKDKADWTVDSYIGDPALKACLLTLLNGADTPALLFTASHGLCFRKGEPLQRDRMGAIVTQDYPAGTWKGPLLDEHYFAAKDVPDNASLLGLISIHFIFLQRFWKQNPNLIPRLEQFGQIVSDLDAPGEWRMLMRRSGFWPPWDAPAEGNPPCEHCRASVP